MVKNRIYLDNCCYNRPYDDQNQLGIEFETKAKLKIQEMIVDGRLELVVSYILEFENDNNPFLERKSAIEGFFRYASIDAVETHELLVIANDIKKTGIKTKDSLHIASAVTTGCDYFITTDKRLLKYNDKRLKILNPVDFVMKQEGSVEKST